MQLSIFDVGIGPVDVDETYFHRVDGPSQLLNFYDFPVLADNSTIVSSDSLFLESFKAVSTHQTESSSLAFDEVGHFTPVKN